MKDTKRSAGLVAVAAALMIFGAASVAWACTQQAFIGSISPGSGPAGSRATVTASRFNPGPVQIRWNGTDGPLLATATGPDFSVGITIPSAGPDTYSVVAVQREGNVVLGKASVSFTVTPANSTMSGGYNSSDGGTTTADGQPVSGSTSRSSSGGQGSSNGSESGSVSVASGNGGAAIPAEAPSAAPAAQNQAAAPGSGAASSESLSSGAARAAQPASGGTMRSPVVGSTNALPDRERAAEPTAAGATATVAPSARSATADLWGGFTSSDPIRSVGLDAPTSSGGSTSPLALGAGLLSGGFAAMFAGFGVAELRRRRVLATSSTR